MGFVKFTPPGGVHEPRETPGIVVAVGNPFTNQMYGDNDCVIRVC